MEILGLILEGKDAPIPILEAPRAILGDTSGSPTERFYWSHFGRVMTERRTELGYPYLNPLEPSFNETIETETKVRKELYG